MKTIKLTILITCVLGFMGCGVNNSDEIERSYPEAYDLETVTIQQLLNEVETPDSVNIDVFVVSTFQCPERLYCFLADRIAVSEKLPPADTLYIVAVEPKQFQKQKQYQISLLVTKRATEGPPHIQLLGYSLEK